MAHLIAPEKFIIFLNLFPLLPRLIRQLTHRLILQLTLLPTLLILKNNKTLADELFSIHKNHNGLQRIFGHDF